MEREANIARNGCRDSAATIQRDDRDLLAAARADPAQFALLYSRYVPQIYRYLRHHVATPQDAEDLTATVFGRALAGLDRYRGTGSVAAWFFGIARHCLADHGRRFHWHADVDTLIPPPIDRAASPETLVLTQERSAMLICFLEALPTDQREAVALRFVGRLRTVEVAQVLGRSEAATKMLVYRAMQTLRARYAEEERA